MIITSPVANISETAVHLFSQRLKSSTTLNCLQVQRNKEYGYGVRLRFLVTFRKSVARSEKKWKEVNRGTIRGVRLWHRSIGNFRKNGTLKEYGQGVRFSSFHFFWKSRRSEKKWPEMPTVLSNSTPRSFEKVASSCSWNSRVTMCISMEPARCRW